MEKTLSERRGDLIFVLDLFKENTGAINALYGIVKYKGIKEPDISLEAKILHIREGICMPPLEEDYIRTIEVVVEHYGAHMVRGTAVGQASGVHRYDDMPMNSDSGVHRYDDMPRPILTDGFMSKYDIVNCFLDARDEYLDKLLEGGPSTFLSWNSFFFYAKKRWKLHGPSLKYALKHININATPWCAADWPWLIRAGIPEALVYVWAEQDFKHPTKLNTYKGYDTEGCKLPEYNETDKELLDTFKKELAFLLSVGYTDNPVKYAHMLRRHSFSHQCPLIPTLRDLTKPK